MTPRELYEWAVENNTEDHEMSFIVNVGNQPIELDINRIERVGSKFVFDIYLD